MFGGFTKDSGPDNTMQKQTKFNVPLTMFSRAQIESKVRAICRKKVQSARLAYMKIPQIPSDSENSDEIFEDIKGLSFIRTPFEKMLIPTVTHTKVKRMERLKSKHLKGNRLKRINLLLFDRKQSIEKNREKYASMESNFLSLEIKEAEVEDEEQKTHELPKIATESEHKSFKSEYRKRYHEFLHENFLEKIEQYNEKLNQKLISFDEFRDKGDDSITPLGSGVNAKTFIDRKSFRDYSETISSNIQSATPDIQKDPAFKKAQRKIRKNMKFSRSDTQTGGFYFDPFLLEKIHNPEKGMKIMKNYTSLMRSQSNVRKRLQVNAPSFEEERCGTKKSGSFYHRLVTEWDNFYVTEIRHRQKVQKFCIKTDIIEIREMVRKKFYLYFMNEDLKNLFANQEIENEMINKTTKFIKVCA